MSMETKFRYARASAPATVANVGPAFDVLGFALSAPSDEVEISLRDDGRVVMKGITGDNGRLSLDAEKNTASVAVLHYLKRINSTQGVEITLHKKLPLGSGMGSSAASAAAALAAVNALFGEPFTREELVASGMEGERVACGTPHADNVGPSIVGGFLLIRSYKPLDVVKLPTPSGLYCTVINPAVEVRTEEARRILPREVPLADAVTQFGNIAGLIAALLTSDLALLSRSLTDVLVEPRRSSLIPGFDEAVEAAKSAGALNCNISGSGPSLFAFSTSQSDAEAIGTAMEKAFQCEGLESRWYASAVDGMGASVQEVR